MAQTNAEIKQALVQSKQVANQREEQKRLAIENAKADREPAIQAAFQTALGLLELSPANLKNLEVDGVSIEFVDPERNDSVLIPQVRREEKMWYWFKLLLTRKTDGLTARAEFEIAVDEEDRDTAQSQAYLHDAIQAVLAEPPIEGGK
jgi:hypothetical protein